MACSVLARVRFVAPVVILYASLVSTSARSIEGQTAPHCRDSILGVPESRQKQVLEFQQRIEAGPFYRELVRQLGKPDSCNSATDESRIRLSYAFHNNARLDAQIDPSIEFSEQRMTLRSLTEKNAMALLHKGEKDAFGNEGCGIRWDRAKRQPREPAGSKQIVYQGKVCNCQARTLYENDLIVALVLSSTC
jgi:hypothetical protein